MSSVFRLAAQRTGLRGLPLESAGADFIRTHDPAALRDGLKIVSALKAAALTY